MVEKIVQYMIENGIDAFFVSNPQNVRYVSGYTGDDSYLLITQNNK